MEAIHKDNFIDLMPAWTRATAIDAGYKGQPSPQKDYCDMIHEAVKAVRIAYVKEYGYRACIISLRQTITDYAAENNLPAKKLENIILTRDNVFPNTWYTSVKEW